MSLTNLKSEIHYQTGDMYKIVSPLALIGAEINEVKQFVSLRLKDCVLKLIHFRG